MPHYELSRTENTLLDFDDNYTWGPDLTAAVGEPLMGRIAEKLVTASPEYVEDACDLLFSYADRARTMRPLHVSGRPRLRDITGVI